MELHKFNIIVPPQDIECNPECLQKIARGSRSAFEWLYKNYSGKLYNYIKVLTNDTSLSEDLVQDIFLKIWKNRERLTTITNFNSYLFYSAKNLLMDKWRRKQLEKEHIKNYIAEEQFSEHNIFFRWHEEKRVNNAIRMLTPRQERIYKLIREEGCSREQVSQQLKIAPNTVKATMQNALSTLRKQLS